MSTILKALRRLEEEDAKGASGSLDGPPAASPGVASEVLRERILAEEKAAEALPGDSGSHRRRVRKWVIAGIPTAAILILGVGASWWIRSDDAGINVPAQRDANGDSRIVAEVTGPPRQSRSQPALVEDAASERQRAGASSLRVRRRPLADAVQASAPVVAAAPTRGAVIPAPAAPRSATVAALPRAPETSPILASPAPGLALPLRRETPVVQPPPVVVVAAPTSAAAPSKAAAPTRATASGEAPEAKSDRGAGSAEPSLATAGVAPTPVVVASKPGLRNIRSLPEAVPRSSEAETNPSSRAPHRDEVERPSVSRDVTSAATAVSVVSPVSPTPASSADSASTPARPIAASRTPEAATVDRIDHRGLPDLVVLRTSWHPSADRRSAKIRVVATDEILVLREGDAVGGLVLQEITPSSVLFAAGEVEVRRKVGDGNP